ncbi:unnamed protein product [Trichobilharzia szidati]|nr:unnamed protein product [Trichobilharzia szidati]
MSSMIKNNSNNNNNNSISGRNQQNCSIFNNILEVHTKILDLNNTDCWNDIPNCINKCTDGICRSDLTPTKIITTDSKNEILPSNELHNHPKKYHPQQLELTTTHKDNNNGNYSNSYDNNNLNLKLHPIEEEKGLGGSDAHSRKSNSDSSNTGREKLLEWLKLSQAKRDENNRQVFTRWIDKIDSLNQLDSPQTFNNNNNVIDSTVFGINAGTIENSDNCMQPSLMPNLMASSAFFVDNRLNVLHTNDSVVPASVLPKINTVYQSICSSSASSSPISTYLPTIINSGNNPMHNLSLIPMIKQNLLTTSTSLSNIANNYCDIHQGSQPPHDLSGVNLMLQYDEELKACYLTNNCNNMIYNTREKIVNSSNETVASSINESCDFTNLKHSKNRNNGHSDDVPFPGTSIQQQINTFETPCFVVNSTNHSINSSNANQFISTQYYLPVPAYANDIMGSNLLYYYYNNYQNQYPHVITWTKMPSNATTANTTTTPTANVYNNGDNNNTNNNTSNINNTSQQNKQLEQVSLQSPPFHANPTNDTGIQSMSSINSSNNTLLSPFIYIIPSNINSHSNSSYNKSVAHLLTHSYSVHENSVNLSTVQHYAPELVKLAQCQSKIGIIKNNNSNDLNTSSVSITMTPDTTCLDDFKGNQIPSEEVQHSHNISNDINNTHSCNIITSNDNKNNSDRNVYINTANSTIVDNSKFTIHLNST